MRRPLGAAWRAGLALALVGGLALAQDATVKKPRQIQPPPAASAVDTTPDTNTLGDPNAVSPTLRGPVGVGSPPPSPVLRSAVHSRWSTPAAIATRGTGACRTQCATGRLACLSPAADDDVPRCNTDWTRCLSACDGLGYGRAPAPNP